MSFATRGVVYHTRGAGFKARAGGGRGSVRRWYPCGGVPATYSAADGLRASAGALPAAHPPPNGAATDREAVRLPAAIAVSKRATVRAKSARLRPDRVVFSRAVMRASARPPGVPLLLCSLLVLLAAPGWLPAVAAAPQAPGQAPPPVATQPPAVGQTAAPAPAPTLAPGVPMMVTPIAVSDAGPLFLVEPLAAALGAELRPAEGGEGWVLAVAGKEVVFGPGSDVAVLDHDVVRLTQAPQQSDAGVAVPLDFLRVTFGDQLGYTFAWDAGNGQLTVRRRSAEELTVSVDVVDVQGLTTVVFQFSAPPRYRVVDAPGGLDVLLLGDRLGSAPDWRQRDPLVAGIEFGRDRIHLDLAPGAAADNYVLEKPFRLVFDVHRAPAPATPSVTPAAPPRESEGVRTIVIDPGHGGNETGAVGPGGTQEKDLTLILAQGLKAALERRLPVRVLLTRGEDAYLPLDTRAAIANQNKADLFISLHLNSVAGNGTKAHGAETYFLSMQASDARAAQSAELENQAGDAGAAGEGGGDPLHDLQLILWDLAQSHYLAESQRLATLIQEELNGALDLRDRGVKQAPFLVLMGAAMPAVLVELGFLSNPDEERKLEDAGYRADLIAALVRAVARYKAEIDARAAGATPAAGPGGTVE